VLSQWAGRVIVGRFHGSRLMFVRALKLLSIGLLLGLAGPVFWSIQKTLSTYLFTSSPAEASRPSDETVVGRAFIARDRSAGFSSGDVLLNGVRVTAVVDTGASLTVLRYDDAVRVGIKPLSEDFRHPLQTANGEVKAAKAELETVVIGGIVERDLKVYVLQRDTGLPYNLLGQNFLTRLRVVMHGDKMELFQLAR
jgi:aspartyl protease family protein